MNIIQWFKRKRPQHPSSDERYAAAAHAPTPSRASLMSREDVHVTLHWGYTPAEWAALPNPIRTAKRSAYYESVGLGR